jgi:hypothetical protein
MTKLEFNKQAAKVWQLRQRWFAIGAELKSAGVPLAQFNRGEWLEFRSAKLNRLAKRYQNAKYKLTMAALALLP